MRRVEFAKWLVDALNEYGAKVETVEVIDPDGTAVGVAMLDGTRFVLDIEAVDESDYATGRRP